MSSSETSPANTSKNETKADQSRDHILSCAAQIFGDKGYAATTLRQIAAAANMKAGSIYYHFSSKSDILDEVLDTGLEQVSKAVKIAVAKCGDDASPEERFVAAIDAHLRAILSHSEFTSVNIRIYSQLPEPIRARHREKRKRYGQVWEQIFQQAIDADQFRKDVKIEPLREFVLGALNWTVEWFDPKKHSLDELIERSTQLVLNGIRKH